MYDLYTESNLYQSLQVFRPDPEPDPSGDSVLEHGEEEPEIQIVNGDAIDQQAADEGKEGMGLYAFVMMSLAFILAVLFIMIVFQYIAYRKYKRNRRHCRKEAGDIWDQQK